MARNPFKPTAGANPPLLVGRDVLVEEFLESIEDGPGAPGRITIFTGPRGIGKTVMLNTVAERVQSDHQWLVIDETATTGFVNRLTAASRVLLDPQAATRRRVKAVTLPAQLGGFELSDDPARPIGLREAAGALARRCEENGTGLLVTLDEVHSSSRDELRQFATAVQHLIREDREIAVAFAGLPAAVTELLNDEVTTFLRRAERHVLSDVPLAEASRALAETITANGRRIDPDALAIAARATGGYPFMIQLVGYQVWRKASGDHIDAEAARVGVEAARARLGSLVHETALAELSGVDRAFLSAMAHDDGPSRLQAIAGHLGKGLNYVSVYRARLLEAGMIAAAGRGKVDFAIPFLREYLREHAPE